jgi:hypothetical protein
MEPDVARHSLKPSVDHSDTPLFADIPSSRLQSTTSVTLRRMLSSFHQCSIVEAKCRSCSGMMVTTMLLMTREAGTSDYEDLEATILLADAYLVDVFGSVQGVVEDGGFV